MASHGPEFVAVYLYLVGRVMGPDDARKLRESFVQRRVRHRAPGVIPEARYAVPTQAAAAARRQAKEYPARWTRPNE
jgi:hypothetical protein